MKVLIYTPTYWKSPGTQYRIDMLKESLSQAGIDVFVKISRENILRNLYKIFSHYLLLNKKTWIIIGKKISTEIAKYRPTYAILVHDVTACASKYLEAMGIRTIISVEDLSARYNSKIYYNFKRRYYIINILCECLKNAWKIITPAYTLSSEISALCGVDVITVPIGLKPYVDFEMAVRRSFPIKIAHVRWLKNHYNFDELIKYIHSNKNVIFFIHNIGLVKNINAPNIIKYRFKRPEEALDFLSRAHYGLIIEYGDFYTLSTFYYHLSLLQPMITKLSHKLQDEARLLGLPINSHIRNEYEKEVKYLLHLRDRFRIPIVHNQLLKWL